MNFGHLQFALVEFLHLQQEEAVVLAQVREAVLVGGVDLQYTSIVVLQRQPLLQSVSADVAGQLLHLLPLKPLKVPKPNHEPLDQGEVCSELF